VANRRIRPLAPLLAAALFVTHAHASLTVTLPADGAVQGIPNAWVDVGVTLTDTTYELYRVVVSVTDGRVRLTTTTGLEAMNAIENFDPANRNATVFTGDDLLHFVGLRSNVINALASLEFEGTQATAGAGTVSVTVHASRYENSGKPSSVSTWTSSCSTTSGDPRYGAVVTSTLEHQRVLAKVPASSERRYLINTVAVGDKHVIPSGNTCIPADERGAFWASKRSEYQNFSTFYPWIDDVLTPGYTQSANLLYLIVSVGSSATQLLSTDMTGNIFGANGIYESTRTVTGTTSIRGPAVVTGISTTLQDGAYPAETTVSIDVAFDRAVQLSPTNATPTLLLNTSPERTAGYQSGSGTNTLTFTYAVQAGDTIATLDVTSMTDAVTLVDQDGVPITADSLPSGSDAGSLASNHAITIDTTDPTVTASRITASGATGTNSTFKIGDTVTVTWSASDGDGDVNLSSVDVNFAALQGPTRVTAQPSGSQWTATYEVASGTTSRSDATVAVTAIDAAGNETTVSSSTLVPIDNVAPSVDGADVMIGGATGTNGAFRIDDTITVTWTDDAASTANVDVATVTMNLTAFGGPSTATATPLDVNGTRTWTASHTLTGSTAIDITGLKPTLTVKDVTGNETVTVATTTVSVDDVAPVFNSLNVTVGGATGANGTFKIYDLLTVSYSDVGVGRAPRNPDLASVTLDLTRFGVPDPVSAHDDDDNDVWVASVLLPPSNLSRSDAHVVVTLRDDAGNETTLPDQDYALDTIAPATPGLIQLHADTDSGVPLDGVTNHVSPTLFGTASIDHDVRVEVAGPLPPSTSTSLTTSAVTVTSVDVATVPVDANGAWSHTLAVSLTDGTYTVSATSINATGNESAEASTWTFTIDTIAPDVPTTPTLAPPEGCGDSDEATAGDVTGDETQVVCDAPSDLTNASRPTLTGTSEPGSTLLILANGATVGTTRVGDDGTWRFTLPEGALREGTNEIHVAARDAAGNLGASSAAWTLTFDSEAPSIDVGDTIINLGYVNAANVDAFTVEGTTRGAEDGQTATIIATDGTTSVRAETPIQEGAWSVTLDLTPLADGPVDLTASVRDRAGNPSTPTTPGNSTQASLAPQRVTMRLVKDTVAPTPTLAPIDATPSGAFTVPLTFDEPVEPPTANAFAVENATITQVLPEGDGYLVEVTPVVGEVVRLTLPEGATNDLAGNPSRASTSITVDTGSPSFAFDQIAEQVDRILQDELDVSLTQALANHDRLLDAARARLFADATCTRHDVAYDLRVDASRAETSASGFLNGDWLIDAASCLTLHVGGDLQMERTDGENSMGFRGDVTLERPLDDDTRIGAFAAVGQRATRLDEATLTGEARGRDVYLGAFGMTRIDAHLSLEGYLAAGVHRLDLDLKDDTLTLTSRFRTLGLAGGVAATGHWTSGPVTFAPRLSLAAGRMAGGDARVNVDAYGRVETLDHPVASTQGLRASFAPSLQLDLTELLPELAQVEPSVTTRVDCETRAEGRFACGVGAGGSLTIAMNERSDLHLSGDALRIDGASRFGFRVTLSTRY